MDRQASLFAACPEKEMKIEYTPIGIIHSPFKEPVGRPIQPAGVAGVVGNVEVFEDFRAGLKDLEEE